MAAHQAPPSLGVSRQEHLSGLLFPSQMRESEVAQSFPTLSDPMDCSLPGSSIHGIFQARVLEWGAIDVMLGQKQIMSAFLNLLGFQYPEEPLGRVASLCKRGMRTPLSSSPYG